METTTFRINFGSAQGSAAESRWLHLEQVKPAGGLGKPSLRDVFQAWNRSATGQSARRYRPEICPVEFDGSTVRIFLGFYVFPSSPGLDYTLSASFGEISGGQQVEVEKRYSIFARNTSGVEITYWLDGGDVRFEGPVFDAIGGRIDQPVVSFDGHLLHFDRKILGPLEVSGRAVGNYHLLTLEVEKSIWKDSEKQPLVLGDDKLVVIRDEPELQNADRIDNVESTITAVWTDSGGKQQTEQLRMEIPQCVLDVLSFCPGSPYYLEWCEKVSDRQVYYSTCTGEVIAVRDGVNEKRYCARIAMETNPSPWLRRLR